MIKVKSVHVASRGRGLGRPLTRGAICFGSLTIIIFFSFRGSLLLQLPHAEGVKQLPISCPLLRQTDRTVTLFPGN